MMQGPANRPPAGWLARLRARFARWWLERLLRLSRRRMVRGIDAEGIRRRSARADLRLAPRQARYRRSERFPVGQAKASWIDAGAGAPRRTLLYLHGGAFVAETPRLHGALLGRICEAAGARALMLDYRLAPEHPFPAATDDCFAAYRHLLDEGHRPGDIVIAGDSAGGNLALVTLLRVREGGLPLPAGAVLLSPVVDFTMASDSLRRNDGLDPLFPRSVLPTLADLYVPEGHRRHPWVSPLLADLDGLPPMLVQVGSSEVLLDEATRLAAKARQVTLEVWHDMPHVFPAFSMLPESGLAIERIARFAIDRWEGRPWTP